MPIPFFSTVMFMDGRLAPVLAPESGCFRVSDGVPLRNPLFPILAGAVWNIGMITGVLSILAGATTGRELLEFPPESAFILFLGLATVSLWAITIIWNRKPAIDLYFAMVSSRGIFVVRMDVCNREPRA